MNQEGIYLKKKKWIPNSSRGLNFSFMWKRTVLLWKPTISQKGHSHSFYGLENLLKLYLSVHADFPFGIQHFSWFWIRVIFTSQISYISYKILRKHLAIYIPLSPKYLANTKFTLDLFAGLFATLLFEVPQIKTLNNFEVLNIQRDLFKKWGNMHVSMN